MRDLRHAANVLLARARALRQGLRPGVEIGAGARFGKHVSLRAMPGGRLVIGSDVEIAPFCSVTAAPGAVIELGDELFIGPYFQAAIHGRLSIGSSSMIAENVTIRDHDHDPAHPPRSGRMLQGDVTIGERVWIASRVTIGRGVTIGNDTVVAAHAFVSRDLPARALAGGVPARIIREHIR